MRQQRRGSVARVAGPSHPAHSCPGQGPDARPPSAPGVPKCRPRALGILGILGIPGARGRALWGGIAAPCPRADKAGPAVTCRVCVSSHVSRCCLRHASRVELSHTAATCHTSRVTSAACSGDGACARASLARCGCADTGPAPTCMKAAQPRALCATLAPQPQRTAKRGGCPSSARRRRGRGHGGSVRAFPASLRGARVS